MDIDGTQMASTIAESGTQYLATFSPVFLLIAGIVLALGIISALVGMISPRNSNMEEDV